MLLARDPRGLSGQDQAALPDHAGGKQLTALPRVAELVAQVLGAVCIDLLLAAATAAIYAASAGLARRMVGSWQSRRSTGGRPPQCTS